MSDNQRIGTEVRDIQARLTMPPAVPIEHVLVTGAAGGLGQAMALAVSAPDVHVTLTDLNSDGLGPVGHLCVAAGANVLSFPADLTADGAAEDLIARASQQAGRPVTHLIHAAGVMQTKPALEISVVEWRRLIDINLTSAFAIATAWGRQADLSAGAAVLVSSVAGRSGRPNAPHYAAAKSGILSLTKSLAMAFGPTLRVNAVCPGVFLTPMWEGIIADRDAEFGPGSGHAYLEQVLAQVPLDRIGHPQELATVVRLLLSDAMSYVTGQALNVDGGLEMD